MFKSVITLSALFSVILYIAAYILVNLLKISIPFLDKVYLPSAVIVIFLSKNPHSINPLLDITVTFIQTYLMVFIITFLVLQIKKIFF